MEFETKYITPDIKLSDYQGKGYRTEMIFEEHLLVWHLSGETTIIREDKQWVLGAGDIFLIPRDWPASVINREKDGRPHQSVVMHLGVERLREFYSRNPPAAEPRPASGIIAFGKHPLLESCLASLVPYFGMPAPFPESVAALKIEEALCILRIIDPGIDGVLANFEEPGKIDLAGFMEKRFMANLPLQRFARLTGRSLSTFQRDFKRIYHTTPERWLLSRRLEYAHQLLKETGKRPVEVCWEVGFVDLSHFSFAFKKRFGYPPTDVASGKAGPAQ